MVPGVDHGQDHHEGGEDEERQADPVDTYVIVGVDRTDPGLVDLELIGVVRPPTEVEVRNDHYRGDEGQDRHSQRSPLQGIFVVTLDEPEDQGAEHRQEDGDRQSPVLYPFHCFSLS